MVFNATFHDISAIPGGRFSDWWRKPEYPEKTTHLPLFIVVRTLIGYLRFINC
jgi:hypothetical protein